MIGPKQTSCLTNLSSVNMNNSSPAQWLLNNAKPKSTGSSTQAKTFTNHALICRRKSHNSRQLRSNRSRRAHHSSEVVVRAGWEAAHRSELLPSDQRAKYSRSLNWLSHPVSQVPAPDSKSTRSPMSQMKPNLLSRFRMRKRACWLLRWLSRSLI
jgi:hypothetical protein